MLRDRSTRKRHGLARSLERAAEPERPCLGRGPRYLVHPTIAVACAASLRAIAAALRDDPDAFDDDALAAVRQFICDGQSPFFGRDETAAMREAVRLQHSVVGAKPSGLDRGHVKPADRSTRGETWIKRLTLGLATAAIALAVVSTVTAGAAVPVFGTATVLDFGSTTCEQTGRATLHCTTTGLLQQYNGSLQGTSILTISGIINCQSGVTTGTATETFTGSIAGIGSGTITWLDKLNARFDCDTFAQFDTHGTSTVMTATDGLAGTKGTVTFTDTGYQGTFH
jgi:hypothetical protein